jgi:AcrR family transcriptional regulator
MEILDAALETIGERGVARTRLQDIAEAMGVSPALVSYHFSSITELFSMAYDVAIERDLAYLDEFEAWTAGASASARLSTLLSRYLPEGQVGTYRLWIEAWVIALHDETMVSTLEAQDARWRNAIEAVIEAGAASGEFATTDPAGAMWRLKMLVDGYSVQSTIGLTPASSAQIHRWIEEAVAHELGVRGFRLAPRQLGP